MTPWILSLGSEKISSCCCYQAPQFAVSGMPLPVAPSHTQQGRRADDPGIFPGDTDLPAPPPPRPWGAAPELRDPRVYKCAPAALACSPPYPHTSAQHDLCSTTPPILIRPRRSVANGAPMRRGRWDEDNEGVNQVSPLPPAGAQPRAPCSRLARARGTQMRPCPP